jgi:membrane protein required for colicin V production
MPRGIEYNPRAMNPVDYILLAVMVISALVGAVRGLLREVVALLTWLVALWAAWQFGPLLEPALGGLLADPDVRPWAARAILFVALLFVGAAIGWIVSYFVRLSLFSGTDRLLGLLFGVARGVVVVGILALLGQTLELDEEPWWSGSLLMPQAERTADALRGLVGEEPFERVTELMG